MADVATNGSGGLAELQKWREEIDAKLAPPKPSKWYLRRRPLLDDLGGKPDEDQVVRNCRMCTQACACTKHQIEEAEAGADDVPGRTVSGRGGEILTLRGKKFDGVLCSPCSAKAAHNWEAGDPIPADEPSDQTAGIVAEASKISDSEMGRNRARNWMFQPYRDSALDTRWGKADRSP